MVSDTAVTIVKILAGCATFVMVSSPIVSMRQIVKQKHVGLVSVIPFVSLLANSHVWMMYGYLTARYFPVFSMFLLGDVLAVIYLCIYWRFTTEKAYMKKVMMIVLPFLAVMSIYAIVGGLGLTGQSRHGVTTTFGGISDFVSLCLYGAPMEKIFQVLRHKSGAFFNFPMVVAALCNNTIWFVYGLLTDNWFIAGPNILFMTLGWLAVGLYIKYNPKTHPVTGMGQPIDESAGVGELHIDIDVEDVTAGGSKKLVIERAASSPTYRAMSSPLQPLHIQRVESARSPKV